MEFAADNKAKQGGWWAVESALSSPQNAFKDATGVVPAGLVQEYSILAGVAANMSSGFLLLNSHERVTYFNASAIRLLGITSRALIEQPVFDIHQQLLTLAAEPVRIQPELDRAWFTPETEATTDIALANAAVRWLRVRFFPLWDNQGSLLGRGVLLDDISLEHGALETRNETLALAAHELKTPLAVIKGCATTLLGNATRWDPAMQREMLQMIDTHADRLYEVLNTLLDMWRLDSGVQTLRLSPVSLAEIVSHLVERCQKDTTRHTFLLRVSTALPTVICDAVRVEQALHALLTNAITYSPNGGTITVQLESNDRELHVSVSDEGIGIAPEHLDHIFDRFYRVHQVQQGEEYADGSGLGLAIARTTFETHGGKIWADSPGQGRGTTFYCTLPLTPTSSPSAFQPSRLPQIAQSQAHTAIATTTNTGPLTMLVTRSTGSLKQNRHSYILVAESDPRLTRYLRANLEEHAYRVQAVSQGVQLLRQLDLEEPDALLLATRQADISGLELLQRIREFSHIPVVMLCDDCDEDERVRYFDLGADDLVLKPFGMKELLARVRALLRRQSATTESPTNQALFTTGDLSIDYAQHLVTLQGQPVQLSRTEYKLLSTLAHNVGLVLTHEVLLERVWGPEYNREVDFIWVYISRLRRKIEADPRHPRYIVTVPDVGYKLAKLP
jgi:DNA-binding response OmpR family regulator/signal transduction histidine kinase